MKKKFEKDVEDTVVKEDKRRGGGKTRRQKSGEKKRPIRNLEPQQTPRVRDKSGDERHKKWKKY